MLKKGTRINENSQSGPFWQVSCPSSNPACCVCTSGLWPAMLPPNARGYQAAATNERKSWRVWGPGVIIRPLSVKKKILHQCACRSKMEPLLTEDQHIRISMLSIAQKQKVLNYCQYEKIISSKTSPKYGTLWREIWMPWVSRMFSRGCWRLS